ncbi:MAG: hypothetical protein ACFFCW_31160 [Candidatus Hodarchaeota archaeon]
MERTYAKFKTRVQDFFFVNLKEFMFTVIFTSVFTFLSFIGHIRTEPSPNFEVDQLYVSYFGFPLEWFKLRSHLSYSWYTVTKLEILWVGFTLDLTLYILVSLVLVHVGNKINDQMSTMKEKRHVFLEKDNVE